VPLLIIDYYICRGSERPGIITDVHSEIYYKSSFLDSTGQNQDLIKKTKLQIKIVAFLCLPVQNPAGGFIN